MITGKFEKSAIPRSTILVPRRSNGRFNWSAACRISGGFGNATDFLRRLKPPTATRVSRSFHAERARLLHGDRQLLEEPVERRVRRKVEAVEARVGPATTRNRQNRPSKPTVKTDRQNRPAPDVRDTTSVVRVQF